MSARARASAKPDARLADADKFLLPTYKRPPIVLTHGRGAYVFDSTGKKYLEKYLPYCTDDCDKVHGFTGK